MPPAAAVRPADSRKGRPVDDKTFDSLAKLSVTSTGRRRLLQAAGAAGIGGLLTRGARRRKGCHRGVSEPRQPLPPQPAVRVQNRRPGIRKRHLRSAVKQL